jgi:preprotein translocase subunit YajC
MQQYTTLIFIALLALVFYFLILRPQRKRQQAIQQTMNALSPGDRVMLASGLFGTVVSVGAKQVVLEVSPGSELTVLKQAISRIVTEADEDSVDEQEEFDEPEGVDEQEPLDEHSAPNAVDAPIAENAAPEEPLQAERPVVDGSVVDGPVEEPTPATAPEPVVEPKSASTRDSKSSTAE